MIEQDLLVLEYIFNNGKSMTIDKITSSIGSSLLFQSLKQNLDDYHQGADRIGRIVYQTALAAATSSSVRRALSGVQFFSSGSQNLLQGSLITALALPIIVNLGDIFTLPISSDYRREIFAMNSNFSKVCYSIMNVAIATLCCSTGLTAGIVTLAALHAELIIERLGLPTSLSSILSISNKLIGGVYGLYSGNYIIQAISFFQTVRSIEKLSIMYIHNKEDQIKSLMELQNLPRAAVASLSSNKVIPARYHLVREDIIAVPSLPSEPPPDFSDMLSSIDWENNARAKKELIHRLTGDSAWCDQWGDSVDIQQAIQHIEQGAKNFSDYMAICPSEMRDRAMWILINLSKKSTEDRIPYLIEMALYMHYCIAGKNEEIERTYGILFNEIDSTSLSSKIHQIMQYKREDLFKTICREEVEKIYSTLEEKINSSKQNMRVYEPHFSDTLTERVQKCLYYIDSYVSHKLWKFRSIIVEKFKEKYMNDVHVYNALKKELTSAMRQQRTPNGFIVTRLVDWLVIKIHELILSPEVMKMRIESLDRMCKEYNTHFVLRQLQDSLQNRDVLHPIDHQHVLNWFQADLGLDDVGVIYEEDATETPTDKIKDNHLLYLLVRIGLLELSNEFAGEYIAV